MTIQVTQVKQKRANYFIKDDEVMLLWKYSKKWSTKWQIIVGLAAFRGMRIGEICSMQIKDIIDPKFQRIEIVYEKSHIGDKIPILKEFSELFKQYVVNNKQTFKDGYLFPYYSNRGKNRNKSHMTTETADAMMSKLRKEIAQKEQYPAFLDPSGMRYLKNGEKCISKYRIGWHSLRRWHETKMKKSGYSFEVIANMMRYQEHYFKTVATYMDAYEVWENEEAILGDVFSDFYKQCELLQKGQTRMQDFTDA